MKKLILGALATMAAVAPAQAVVTFTTSDGSAATFAGSAAVGGAITFNLDALNAPTVYGGTVRSGSLGGEYAQPAGSDGSQYLQIATGQTATFTSATGTKYFSIYIGSIDKFNSISFFDSTNALLGTFTGADIGNPSDGDQGSPQNNRWVVFEDSANSLSTATLNSSGKAFEVDNVAFTNAVPEPATWAMMITGFGFVGGAMRRRRSEETLATA